MDEHEVLAAIMDRLQRVRAGESRDNVYHRASACDRYEMWCRDAHDFANAILPKGKRPVAMAMPKSHSELQTGWFCNEHRDYSETWQAWRTTQTYYDNAEKRNGYRGGGPIYASQAEARAELEWRYFDQWRAKCERLHDRETR